MHIRLKTVTAVTLGAVAITAALIAALANIGGTQLFEVPTNTKMVIVDEMLDAAFNKFIPMFQKNYKDQQEYFKRKSIF
jgi:hypothetical protein